MPYLEYMQEQSLHEVGFFIMLLSLMKRWSSQSREGFDLYEKCNNQLA